ncbi:MAG: hypothetical protein M3T55_02950 [Pseudomonadota bacterium]|nr:hypothetical protein [Pseudomonadota bacterium]
MTAVNRTRTPLRRRLALAMAIAAIGGAGVANARPDPDLVDLKVVDRETGQELQAWRHHGRLFVAGEPGARYGLRVTNHTDGRVLVVMSVDGINVVTGATASYDQGGYVLGPHGSYEVTGWRKSYTEVAAFAFAPLPQSYAARTGRPGDVGVIGMAVFAEKAPLPAPVLEAPAARPDVRDGSSPGSHGHGASDAGPSRWTTPSRTARRAALPAVAPNIPAPPPLFIAPWNDRRRQQRRLSRLRPRRLVVPSHMGTMKNWERRTARVSRRWCSIPASCGRPSIRKAFDRSNMTPMPTLSRWA